jgi:cell division protein FtsB
MRGIKNREAGKWKRIGIFFVLLILFGVLVNSVHNVYSKKKEAENTLARMQKEVKDLEDREKFLSASLQRLNTAEGIAFELRKKLNVAEAGEKVAVIVENQEPTSTPPAETSAWHKIKNFFVDLFK